MHKIIYFGDANTSIAQHLYQEQKKQVFSSHAPFAQWAHDLKIDQFIFLKQEHTSYGFQVTSDIESFQTVGDYLITNRPAIGIGVMTADCLPIIVWDSRHHAIGIAHAGWKGAVGNIALSMIEHMQRSFYSQPSDLAITFGPCARQCCYQVGADFVSNISEGPWIIDRHGFWYFDLVLYVGDQLRKQGVTCIDQQSARCTICNERFCSYRRNQKDAWRQISFAALRP